MTDNPYAAEQAALAAATNELEQAIAADCPGRHGVVQHRDGQPAWCPYCGRTRTGALVGGHRRGEPRG